MSVQQLFPNKQTDHTGRGGEATAAPVCVSGVRHLSHILRVFQECLSATGCLLDRGHLCGRSRLLCTPIMNLLAGLHVLWCLLLPLTPVLAKGNALWGVQSGRLVCLPSFMDEQRISVSTAISESPFTSNKFTQPQECCFILMLWCHC